MWSVSFNTIRDLVLLVPPRLGHLAPASDVVGGHTLPFLKGHGLPKMVRYVLLRPPTTSYEVLIVLSP
jgi:hypothetical protein